MVVTIIFIIMEESNKFLDIAIFVINHCQSSSGTRWQPLLSNTSKTSRTTGSGFPIASTMSARASKIFIVVTIIIIIVVIIIVITTPPRPLTWGRMPVGEPGGVQLTLREVTTTFSLQPEPIR